LRYKPPYLATQAAIVVCFLLSANVFIRVMAYNSIPRQKMRLASSTPHATDLFLGNSTMEAAVDLNAFRRSFPDAVPLNLAIGATSPIEHMLVFSQIQSLSQRRVYYGFIEDQLTRAPNVEFASLTGNRAMSYYVNPDMAIRLMGMNDLCSRFMFRFLASNAVYVERARIWAQVEKVRRWLSELGFPKQVSNRFGRVADFDKIDTGVVDEVITSGESKQVRVQLIPPVTELLRKSKSDGALGFVIEMPRPSHVRKGVDTVQADAYRKRVKKLVECEGAIYLNASDWVGDDGFSDSLHLNEVGATCFTSELAKVIGLLSDKK